MIHLYHEKWYGEGWQVLTKHGSLITISFHGFIAQHQHHVHGALHWNDTKVGHYMIIKGDCWVRVASSTHCVMCKQADN